MAIGNAPRPTPQRARPQLLPWEECPSPPASALTAAFTVRGVLLYGITMIPCPHYRTTADEPMLHVTDCQSESAPRQVSIFSESNVEVWAGKEMTEMEERNGHEK
jgi:hypothetical protein